jgi:hypothetical protein
MKLYTIDSAARAYRQRLRTELVRMQAAGQIDSRRITQIQHESAISAEHLVHLHPHIVKPCIHCGEPVHHGVEIADHLQESRHTVLCASCVTAAAQLLHLKIR